MSAQQRWLVAFYAVVALAALAATWSQNLQLMAPGMGPLDPYAAFIEQAGANAAARSITVDIAFFLLAAAAFMIIEARRLGVRFVWAYILLGFFIAISVTFPLFMIAREFRLAAVADPGGAWSIKGVDLLGLAVVAALVLGLSWSVLT
jgi:hypothetical protein